MKFVKNVKKEKKALMDHLILEKDTKDMISAIASSQLENRAKQWNADFIRGKGEGKFVLLHGRVHILIIELKKTDIITIGAPGTGKTLTVGKGTFSNKKIPWRAYYNK